MKPGFITGGTNIIWEEYNVDIDTISKSLELLNNVQWILVDCTFGRTKAKEFNVVLV